MTDDEIYSALTEILGELFPRAQITATPTTSAREVIGWDSMKQVELIMAAEDRFGIQFKSKDVENLDNLGGLVAAIHRRLAGG